MTYLSSTHLRTAWYASQQLLVSQSSSRLACRWGYSLITRSRSLNNVRTTYRHAASLCPLALPPVHRKPIPIPYVAQHSAQKRHCYVHDKSLSASRTIGSSISSTQPLLLLLFLEGSKANTVLGVDSLCSWASTQ